MEQSEQKKRWILYLYQIMYKFTDENHRLSQKEIGDLLLREYGVKADRKAISRNLHDLIAAGVSLCYTEKPRVHHDGTEEIMRSEWYMEHEFSNSELRLLIDGLLFSRHIPTTQRATLIEKLEHLAGVHFSARTDHIHNISPACVADQQLFYTIDTLDEAIMAQKQVEFEYCSYDIDKKLKPRRRENGGVRKYLVNPYQLATKHGRYYLICNYDKYDGLSHYRIDRIRNIRLCETPVKPCPIADGATLAKHMREHIYMFTGESIQVRFRAKRSIINDIIDYFGLDVRFSDATQESVMVSVAVNEEDMFRWAVQYCNDAEVIEPPALRQRIAETLSQAVAQYLPRST